MKQKLQGLFLATAIISPTMVQAAPTVYGKVHLSLGRVETETAGTSTDSIQLRSHASRFGLKGDHDLENGLKATYKLEYEVNPDDNNAKDPTVDSGSAGLSRRNQYLGLKGQFGELRFGRHDTPLKMSQGKFDQFNDTDADLKYSSAEDGEHRFDNMLLYLGQTGSVSYAVALIPGEGDGRKTVDGGTGTGNGLADNISASVAYQQGPLYVALAHDQYDDTNGQQSNSLTRLVGTYKLGGMQFGLFYQTGVESATASDDEVDTIGASFNTETGARGKAKLQYMTSENSANPATDTTLVGIGYDHKYSKTVTGYVMYANVEVDDGTNTNKDSFIGTGMVVKF